MSTKRLAIAFLVVGVIAYMYDNTFILTFDLVIMFFCLYAFGDAYSVYMNGMNERLHTMRNERDTVNKAALEWKRKYQKLYAQVHPETTVKTPPKATTCWDTLGISPTRNKTTIQQAYRMRAALLHPDKPNGSTLEMSTLNIARETALQYAQQH